MYTCRYNDASAYTAVKVKQRADETTALFTVETVRSEMATTCHKFSLLTYPHANMFAAIDGVLCFSPDALYGTPCGEESRFFKLNPDTRSSELLPGVMAVARTSLDDGTVAVIPCSSSEPFRDQKEVIHLSCLPLCSDLLLAYGRGAEELPQALCEMSVLIHVLTDWREYCFNLVRKTPTYWPAARCLAMEGALVANALLLKLRQDALSGDYGGCAAAALEGFEAQLPQLLVRDFLLPVLDGRAVWMKYDSEPRNAVDSALCCVIAQRCRQRCNLTTSGTSALCSVMAQRYRQRCNLTRSGTSALPCDESESAENEEDNESAAHTPTERAYFKGWTVDADSYIDLVSWNVLADGLAQSGKFGHIRPDHLEWAHRFRHIQRELRSMEIDVMCLQEVTHMEDFMAAFPEHHFYFNMKPDRAYGCAVGIHKQLPLVVNSVTMFQFPNAIVVNGSFADKPISIANVHLKAKPAHDELRREQLRNLFANSSSRIDILCGDFNADLRLEKELKDMLQELDFYPTNELVPTSIKQRLGEPFKAMCSDYILGRTDSLLQPVRTLSLPSVEDIGPKGLPQEHFPSDHLPVATVFRHTATQWNLNDGW